VTCKRTFAVWVSEPGTGALRDWTCDKPDAPCPNAAFKWGYGSMGSPSRPGRVQMKVTVSTMNRDRLHVLQRVGGQSASDMVDAALTEFFERYGGNAHP
jgi:hypothetical protein